MSDTQYDDLGRDLKTGKFTKGFAKGGPGRPKGSRNKMTQTMLDRVACRSEKGLSMDEIMMDIAQDPQQPADLRFKCAKAVADLVYPKAASVEVTVDDKDGMSKQEIEDRLTQLMAMANAGNEQ